MSKFLIGYVFTAMLLLAPLSPACAQSSGQPGKAPLPPGSPQAIYVTDFVLEIANISEDAKLVRRPKIRQDDPYAKSRKLIELLSTSLTKELQEKGLPASRLYQNANVPDKGWMVKGQFLEVDQGNRLRRTIVGFGAGATEMQIEVAVLDLAKNAREPFMVFGTEASSGKGPGAVVTMNPYVAAAKFVMSKKASEKDVKKTAKQIAGVLAKYIEDNRQQPK
ncbi:MAG: DUF4410 domain-containing protein [Desulfobacteraceae bacterium]|nr:DUF4410 domain-containing protein [Desulfobacteraceae bacterium]